MGTLRDDLAPPYLFAGLKGFFSPLSSIQVRLFHRNPFLIRITSFFSKTRFERRFLFCTSQRFSFRKRTCGKSFSNLLTRSLCISINLVISGGTPFLNTSSFFRFQEKPLPFPPLVKPFDRSIRLGLSSFIRNSHLRSGPKRMTFGITVFAPPMEYSRVLPSPSESYFAHSVYPGLLPPLQTTLSFLSPGFLSRDVGVLSNFSLKAFFVGHVELITPQTQKVSHLFKILGRTGLGHSPSMRHIPLASVLESRQFFAPQDTKTRSYAGSFFFWRGNIMSFPSICQPSILFPPHRLRNGQPSPIWFSPTRISLFSSSSLFPPIAAVHGGVSEIELEILGNQTPPPPLYPRHRPVSSATAPQLFFLT